MAAGGEHHTGVVFTSPGTDGPYQNNALRPFRLS
jgi:hypothetical protein